MVSKLDRLIQDYHSLECEFNIDKSIEVCEEILKIDPTLIEYRENLASSYYNKEEYDKSIQIYNECLEGGEDKDTIYLMISLAYIKMNEREKAFESMENIENEEDYLLSHLRIHKELNEYDQAIKYGDMALELNPENKNALYLMTEIYDILDDGERSAFYFGELVNLNPELKSLEIIKLYDMKKYKELIEIFEEGKADGIFNSELEDELFNCIIGMSYYHLNQPYNSLKYLIYSDKLKGEMGKKATIAKNYFDLYEFNKAYKYLREGLEIEPLNYALLFLMVETNYFRKEYIQAIEYANTILKNYGNEDIYRVLAAIFFDLGDIKEGWKCIYSGSSPEDYKGDYIFKITDILSKSGQSERALNIFRILEEKIPEFPFTYIERAKHYKRIGEMDLAKKDFEKYNELWFGDDCSFEDL